VTVTDIIADLAGLAPESDLARARDLRAVARAQSQRSYQALFEPADPGDVSLVERLALAVFIARLHDAASVTAHYEAHLRQAGGAGLAAAIETAAASGRTQGPYGAYPAGPLTAENTPGPDYAVPPTEAERVGPRLAAACRHAHMLVFHPRDAAAATLQALLDAGWSTTAIVTLSQLVAFLAYQIRVVHGLAVLARA
jgi:CMD domain protein